MNCFGWYNSAITHIWFWVLLQRIFVWFVIYFILVFFMRAIYVAERSWLYLLWVLIYSYTDCRIKSARNRSGRHQMDFKSYSEPNNDITCKQALRILQWIRTELRCHITDPAPIMTSVVLSRKLQKRYHSMM